MEGGEVSIIWLFHHLLLFLQCQGIAIEGRILMNQLTREMTPGELKFALSAEQVLNSVPQPEYRQLMVEALMVLTLLIDNIPSITNLGKIINVEQLVHRANRIFLEEQVRGSGERWGVGVQNWPTLGARLIESNRLPFRRSSVTGTPLFVAPVV